VVPVALPPRTPGILSGSSGTGGRNGARTKSSWQQPIGSAATVAIAIPMATAVTITITAAPNSGDSEQQHAIRRRIVHKSSIIRKAIRF